MADGPELPHHLDLHLTPESLARTLELAATRLTPERLADPHCEVTVGGEFEFIRRDGSTFWADTLFTLLRDMDGKPAAILGVGKDITERRQAEVEVRQHVEALEASRRAVLNLMADVDAARKAAEQANVVLQQEMGERMQAQAQMAKQLDELRRLHAAFMGREMRILALKRELNELLTQAGQPPRYTSVLEQGE